MPNNIDMSAIKEALARRSGGQASMPMGEQSSQQVAPSGMGGSATQTAATPAQGQATPAGQGGQGGGQMPAGIASMMQATQAGGFDDETKRVAKVLMTKLLKVM